MVSVISNKNNSIYIWWFDRTVLNDFKYCYLTQIILFDIGYLFAHRVSGYKSCYITLIILFNTIHSVAWNQMGPIIAMYYLQFKKTLVICLNAVISSNSSISNNSTWH